jgi:hypothetical protein
MIENLINNAIVTHGIVPVFGVTVLGIIFVAYWIT